MVVQAGRAGSRKNRTASIAELRAIHSTHKINAIDKSRDSERCRAIDSVLAWRAPKLMCGPYALEAVAAIAADSKLAKAVSNFIKLSF